MLSWKFNQFPITNDRNNFKISREKNINFCSQTNCKLFINIIHITPFFWIDIFFAHSFRHKYYVERCSRKSTICRLILSLSCHLLFFFYLKDRRLVVYRYIFFIFATLRLSEICLARPKLIYTICMH